jgi:endonuclease IV
MNNKAKKTESEILEKKLNNNEEAIEENRKKSIQLKKVEEEINDEIRLQIKDVTSFTDFWRGPEAQSYIEQIIDEYQEELEKCRKRISVALEDVAGETSRLRKQQEDIATELKKARYRERATSNGKDNK